MADTPTTKPLTEIMGELRIAADVAGPGKSPLALGEALSTLSARASELGRQRARAVVAAARALRAPSDRPIYLPPYERLSVTKASSDVDEAPDTDRTEYELSSCPACSSPDLAVDATAGVTLCEGCGSIITQAGIDALATSEHPEPTGPLDELP